MNATLLFAAIPLLLVAALRLAVHRSLAPARVGNRLLPAQPGWQRLRVSTQRGRSLSVWLQADARPAPLLLAVHGWGGNADSLLPLAAPLRRAGYAVALFDTRCHGDSDEDDFASLPRFAEDLEAVLAALAGQPGIDPRRIAVFGHSVGAGAALLAASRRPDIAAVVSLAAFAHPAEMMRRWLTGKGLRSPWLQAALLNYVQRVIGFRFDDIAPIHTIARSQCPVLLLHGEDDDTVPADDARRLLAAAARDNVRLRLLAGSHDEFAEIDRHLDEVLGFLGEALVPGGNPAPAAGSELGTCARDGGNSRPD